ncbi:polymeric immunoglobulin receptor-like [Paramormyrops kingsleyae]|uniref:polymeric immunoglobulin receptor-like n=1 Tax=Paramormyrops kingsleyae TaxID=1676925 RepID=UPI003B96F7CF
MDPLMLLFLLIAGLTGADSVSSVGWVSVLRGGSVTIPCHYDDRYKPHVKYWCRGSDCSSCTTIVRTDFPRKKDEMSIRDDPDQRVFTVTMNNLQTAVSDYYWCCVEISRGSAVGTRVYLSVTEGVSTVRWVTVQSGGSVTIPCFYDNIYQKHDKYWCNGSDWSSCTPIVRTDSPQKKNEVSIRDDPDQRVFTVTMNNLQTGVSDYYWCGVEISGGSPVGTPVYLSVTEGSPGLSVDKQEMTGVEGDSVSVQCEQYEYYYRELSWCRMGGSCITRSSGLDGRPVLITGNKVKKVIIVTMRGLQRKDTGWYWCDNGNQQIPVHITVNLRTTTATSTERANSVSSVGSVSVQRGGSVTIPCSYEDSYKTHAKYWCRENYSSGPCSPIVRTDSPQTNNEVSIRDDPDQSVFTVTINNLTAGDSGYYWCGVEISGGSAVGTWIQLSVTEGVSTVNTVSVQRGGSVTIPCFYDNIYKQHEKYWCNGSDWSSCTPIVHTDSPNVTGEVSIRDYPDQQVFNVTMNKQTTVNSGYYWCGVEISRGSAVGTWIYLSVTEDDEGGNNEKQSLFLYVGLGLLVLLLIIIIITWKVWDKHKKNMAMNQNPGYTELTLNPDHEYAVIDRTGIIKGDPAEQLNPDHEYDVIDRTGIIKGDPAKQASVEPGADVTYSSILLPDPQVSSRCSSHRPAVTPASDVVYSSVALKHRE